MWWPGRKTKKRIEALEQRADDGERVAGQHVDLTNEVIQLCAVLSRAQGIEAPPPPPQEAEG